LGCSITYCMYFTHHASNPSVSNSCLFGFRRKPPPQGRFSSALPPT